MKRMISWAIGNAPGMNILMCALMLIGGFCLTQMRREVFPEFELEVIMVSVPYPGATPQDCEEGICQKIEESIRSISGIKKVTSIAQEGGAFVLAELDSDVPSVQKVMSEIDREVDRIPSFPVLAEDPQIQQITFRDAAIRVGIIGPSGTANDGGNTLTEEISLRSVADEVRDEILMLPAVSTASIMGSRPFQIDVEIPESTLRSHDLTLTRVASIIRDRNVELPGGQLKSEGQEVLLRAKNKRRIGEEIKKLPVVTRNDGVVLSIGDLGNVNDGFEDSTMMGEINGEPAMVVNVERSKSEDLLAMVDAVRNYIDQKELPEGYRFEIWGDSSTEVRGRLALLRRNGLQGLLLVFLVLTLFLEMRLAFWVALGIPVSILGAGAALALGDQTLNMLSLFSFLVALGIVVDDAIVIGENIYAHRQMGKTRKEAALDGTVEVFPSVAASVTTTVIAFAPMFFVSGVMGKFMAVIPFAVIAMLVISLWESIFVLPSHLAHSHTGFFRVLEILMYPLRPLGLLLGWLGRRFAAGLNYVCNEMYVPALRFSLRYPLVPISAAVMLTLATLSLVTAGTVPLILFPKSDNNFLQAVVVFPDGTPESETKDATREMEKALRRVSESIAKERMAREGRPIEEIYPVGSDTVSGPVRLTYREVGNTTNTQNPAGGGGSGSAVGQIFAELYDTEIREIHSNEILARWREETGDFPGVESVTYGSVGVGPGGKAIEFKLLAQSDDLMMEKPGEAESLKQAIWSVQDALDLEKDLEEQDRETIESIAAKVEQAVVAFQKTEISTEGEQPIADGSISRFQSQLNEIVQSIESEKQAQADGQTDGSAKSKGKKRDSYIKLFSALEVAVSQFDLDLAAKQLVDDVASKQMIDKLEAATEDVKAKLRSYKGVFDIADDNTPGKWEFQFRVKDQALATGITPTELGNTVRNTYFGAEAMRLQRGRHEVKLMVRYPEEERRSLVNFREIRVSDNQGNEYPIEEIAEVSLDRGPSEINRVDQLRSITVSADLDEKVANSSLIINDLKESFIPMLTEKYPGLSVRWEGQAEQSRESVGSLMIGFCVAIIAMYVLLVLQFRSYVQPLLILLIVPFGMIGAVWGHAFLGLPLTLFSMFGLVALSGVVINDSIVLIDFINTRVRSGQPAEDALAEAGQRRFRPILLTSMTTIAGLIPLMLERSFQAQLLIPMAASLAFGLLLATVLVLFLVPVFYALYLRGYQLLAALMAKLKITDGKDADEIPAATPATAQN